MTCKRNLAEITHLHNLYPSETDPAVFCPMGQPRKIAPEGLTPLCAMNDNYFLATTPSGMVTVDIDTGATVAVDRREGIAADKISHDRMFVMTESGSLTLRYEDKGVCHTLHDSSTLWNGISITAVGAAPVSVAVEALTLSRSYNPAESISPADCLKARKAVAAAYRNAASLAASEGVLIQPVLARAIVKDSEGNVVHRGPATLVLPPQGLFFETPVRLSMNDGVTTSATLVNIPSFRLRVVCEPTTTHRDAEAAVTLDIEISSPFHTWTNEITESIDTVNVVRRNVGGLDLSVTWPGVENGLSTMTPGRNLRRILSRLDQVESAPFRVASFPYPYDRGIDCVVEVYSQPSLTEAGGSAATKTFSHSSDSFFYLNCPHTFNARHVSITPGAVVYADITPLRFPGFSPAEYASTLSADKRRWKSKVTVQFNDGRSTCRIGRHSTFMPLQLGALVEYPHPEARIVDVVIEEETQGAVPMHWRINLEPYADGNRAIGLTEDLSARDFYEDGDARIGTEETRWLPDSRQRATVGVATCQNPSSVKGIIGMNADVTAVLKATSTSAAWDFGRTRFYIFTADKVSLLNTAAPAGRQSTVPVVFEGIDDPGAVAATDVSTVFFVAKNGFVYRIDGTQAKVLAKLPAEVDRLGYDPTDRRLVAGASSGAGPLYHIDTATGKTVMTSTAPQPFDPMLTTATHLVLPSQEGLLDAALERRVYPSEGMSIGMTCISPSIPPRGSRTLRSVCFNLDASHFDGTLSVNRIRPGDSCLTTGLRVKGRLTAPLSVPVLSRPFNGVSVEIKGIATSDTRISVPTLNFTSQ